MLTVKGRETIGDMANCVIVSTCGCDDLIMLHICGILCTLDFQHFEQTLIHNSLRVHTILRTAKILNKIITRTTSIRLLRSLDSKKGYESTLFSLDFTI